jgi:two-component system, chemotaxis family, protein-glutamate methylesterase/glutaminase
VNQLKAIVIGASAGGLKALRALLEKIPSEFTIPILIVQHIGSDSENSWIYITNEKSKIMVKEGEDKEQIMEGHVYIAPPDYHMLVEYDKTLALSKDERVNYSRPSIDVLFESAAAVYGKDLAGIVLTGSNHDGSKGLGKIKENGGITIVQDPAEAEYKEMPEAAIRTGKADHIITLQAISDYLINYSLKKH